MKEGKKFSRSHSSCPTRPGEAEKEERKKGERGREGGRKEGNLVQ